MGDARIQVVCDTCGSLLQANWLRREEEPSALILIIGGHHCPMTLVNEDADHCTPEERAVIDAAVSWFNGDDDDHRLPPTLAKLGDTVDQLLAMRSKSG